jgi:hypothetical protein
MTVPRILFLSVAGVGVAIVGFLLGATLYEIDHALTVNGVDALVPWFLRAR